MSFNYGREEKKWRFWKEAEETAPPEVRTVEDFLDRKAALLKSLANNL